MQKENGQYFEVMAEKMRMRRGVGCRKEEDEEDNEGKVGVKCCESNSNFQKIYE